MAPLQHRHQPSTQQRGRAGRRHIAPVIDNAPAAQLPALGGQQVGDRFQSGGLARAVGAQQRVDLSGQHLQVHAVQRDDGLLVDHLQRLDPQQRRSRCGALQLRLRHAGQLQAWNGGCTPLR
ncbi:hypothetical protein SDC9_95566 [bioreactor metagenome]|uniref:Uncharacterized protein n=1 Tax=bioreactor metagenome TaxID=1076179 RepID=A0A645A6P5_9ZZZZ